MVELEDVENAIKKHPSPVVTTTDLADELDCSSRHILDQLKLLRRAGAVERKNTGARSAAWWHTDRVNPPLLDPDEHPDQTGLDETRELARQRPPARGARSDRRETPLEDDLAALDDVLPGEDELLEERRAAVRACYEYLRENGTATKSDFTENVYPDHSAGYASAGGWWNTVGKKGLRALAERRDEPRAPAGEGSHRWRYLGRLDEP